MEKRKFGALSSSVNPQELSLTISSIVRMLAYIVSSIATIKGVSVVVDNVQIEEFTAAMVNVVVSGLVVFESGKFALGIFRKVAAKLSGN